MKKNKARFYAGFFLLIFVVSSSHVFSEGKEYRRNYLYHLSYIFPRHYFLESEVEYKRVLDSIGTTTDDEKKISFNQSVRVGIDNTTELNVTLGYLFSGEKKSLNQISNSSGLKDLTIAFRKRVFEKTNENDRTLDLILRLTPDLDSKKIADPYNDGNAFSGQRIFELEGVWGVRELNSEFSFHTSLSMLGRENVLDQSLGLKYKSNYSYLAKAFFVMQPRLKNGHYLLGTLGVEKRGSRKIMGFEEKEKLSFYGHLSYTYKLAARFALGANFRWQEKNLERITGSTRIDIDRNLFSFGISALYLFY